MMIREQDQSLACLEDYNAFGMAFAETVPVLRIPNMPNICISRMFLSDKLLLPL
jgi:hypothetical protein